MLLGLVMYSLIAACSILQSIQNQRYPIDFVVKHPEHQRHRCAPSGAMNFVLSHSAQSSKPHSLEDSSFEQPRVTLEWWS